MGRLIAEVLGSIVLLAVLAALLWLGWRFFLDPQRELERRIAAQGDAPFTLATLWSETPAPEQWRLLGPYADAHAACGAPCADLPRWVPECESWWLGTRGGRVLTVQRVQCNLVEWSNELPVQIAASRPLQRVATAQGRPRLVLP